MEWISVEDNLPDYDKKVFIWQGDDGVYKGMRTHTDSQGENWLNMECDDGSISEHVTHWMEIPTKPLKT